MSARAGGEEKPAGAENGTGPNHSRVHVISWNVAGWSKALAQIRKRYGSLGAWMERHHADILCLQEVKTTDQKLQSCTAEMGADEPGYESFWSPCAAPSGKGKGFNGVATFARSGLTLAARRDALGDTELDKDGRCIVTDHGPFVLFNVYVPNDGPGSRALPKKMAFLKALRRAMSAERKRGKRVILVGDLNIHRRSQDCTYSSIMLDVPEFLRRNGGSPALAAARRALVSDGLWSAVQRMLTDDKDIVERDMKVQGRVIKRWRVCVKGPDGNKAYLGRPFQSKERASGSCDDYSIKGRYVDDKYTGSRRTARPPNEIRVEQLAECVRIASNQRVDWSQRLQQEMALAFGKPISSPCCIAWLDGDIIRNDKMVDTFSHLWPHALDRFTCWDQYKNRRYFNQGARIDYVLVDATLMPSVLRGAAKLPTGLGNVYDLDPKYADPNTRESARAAATSRGKWQPAPFEGGGLPDGTQRTYDTQFYTPHTGIVYTPPQFSDHIGVSLLLDGEKLSAPLGPPKGAKHKWNKSSRTCQPHKKQSRISAFFRAVPTTKSAKTKDVKVVSLKKKRKPDSHDPKKKGKGGLRDFFGPKLKREKRNAVAPAK